MKGFTCLARRTENASRACRTDILILRPDNIHAGRVTLIGTEQRKRGSIDPAIKSWVDNVIVPALLERWEKLQETGAAA